MQKTRNPLSALIALTALTTVEHNGVKYGPGQPAGSDFEASEADAEPLLQVKAVKVYDPNAATQESLIVGQATAATANASAALSQANEALQKARADAETVAQAQAKVDADAKDLADARAKLEAEIKAFEEAKAAAAKAAVKKV